MCVLKNYAWAIDTKYWEWKEEFLDFFLTFINFFKVSYEKVDNETDRKREAIFYIKKMYQVEKI